MYGISEEELSLNNGVITEEQKEKNLKKIKTLNIKIPFNINKVDPWCHACVLCQLDKYEKFVDRLGRAAKGKFNVNCEGISNETLDSSVKNIYSKEEWEELEAQSDVIKWAKKYLTSPNGEPWEARWYQEKVLQCTARRKALRVSRRTGKTTLVCVEILYHLFTQENRRILVVGPYKTHAEEIFNRLKEFIYSSPVLSSSVTKDIQAPYYRIRLSNGSEVRGFAGGDSSKGGDKSNIRGQDSDRVYIEEMQYLSEAAISGSILPILQTHANTYLIGFSTPNPMRTTFYRLCKESPECKEFFYTYKVLPHYKEVEKDKAGFTESRWEQEFLAEFGGQDSGVYNPKYIDSALWDYKYAEFSPNPSWKYCVGTDWNEKFGTELFILGYDPLTNKLRAVYSEHVEPSQFTQLDGVNRIIDLNRKWKPSYIYLDAGNGSLNYEILMKTALDARGKDPDTARLIKTLKKYDSGAVIEIKDPLTKQDVRKPAKAFMVSSSVRFLEQGMLILSKHDTKLEKQMRNYIIVRYTPNNTPVYGMSEAKIGDHRLDAFTLALVAFELEFGDLNLTRATVCLDMKAMPDPRNMKERNRAKLLDIGLEKSRRIDQPNATWVGELIQNNRQTAYSGGRSLELKTNRPGWDTDQEEYFTAIARQNSRSRRKIGNDKPSRSNF